MQEDLHDQLESKHKQAMELEAKLVEARAHDMQKSSNMLARANLSNAQLR